MAIRLGIEDLILKNAIVQVNDFLSFCLSPIFVVPMKSGDLRLFLNLKNINVFIPFSIFQDGNTECVTSPSLQARLGSNIRLEGRIFTCSFPSTF